MPHVKTLDSTRPFWLALAQSPFGSAAVFRALHDLVHGDGERGWHATESEWRLAGAKEETWKRIRQWRATVNPTALASQIPILGLQTWWFTDADFPPDLEQLADPPALLYYRGRPQALQLPRIALIGTRRPSSYGLQVTDLLATSCARHHIAVVSGLALGIDGRAHESVLRAQGIGIGILGSGADPSAVYPSRHRKLADTLCEQGGLLITEVPPQGHAEPFRFPQRNRLIAALSRAIVIVEAAPDSGSLITAQLGLDLGRDILAVPGPITSEASRGTNQLIADGAIPCRGMDDIFRVLKLPDAKPMPQASPCAPRDSLEEKLLHAVSSPRSIDELAAMLDLPISTLSAKLGSMELEGWIHRQTPRIFLRNPSSH